jgi:hypothetical protein
MNAVKDYNKFYSVEGQGEFLGDKGYGYCDEFCGHCSNETYNVPINRISLCAHCGAEMFPCAACDDNNIYAKCDWDSEKQKCHLFQHSKDFIEEKERRVFWVNEYEEMKDRHQAEFNKFPMCFAFDNQQFAEAMGKLGLTINDTDKVYSFAGGGIFRKEDFPWLEEMFERHAKELDKAMQITSFAISAFYSELSNHEYTYTWDYEPALEALGLTENDLEKDKFLNRAFQRAIKLQKKQLEKSDSWIK